MKKDYTLRQARGFTLVEILAVLVLLGVLAAVAVPRYLELADDGRSKAAEGQIAQVKGRLKLWLSDYLLVNRGLPPLDGLELMDYVTIQDPAACPGVPSQEGAFEFQCQGSAGFTAVTITVTSVQGRPLTPEVSGSFSF